MSDQAPPSDADGNIYLTTGNGSFNGTTQFGESFLKLTNTGAALSRADWFTPYDWNTNLNAHDADLGSGGVLLIPGTSLLFSGGKAGRLYLVDATNMGHLVNAAATSDRRRPPRDAQRRRAIASPSPETWSRSQMT